MQLRDWNVHIGVVVSVQRDPAYTDPVGEEQICFWGVVTRPSVSLEKDARGTGTGRAVGTRQAQVAAASVALATLVKA